MRKIKKVIFFVFAICVWCFIGASILYLFLEMNFYSKEEESALLNENIEIGNLVVKAIEQYNLDHGKYPDSLQDLIPDYFDSPIITTYGKEFHYEVNNFYNTNYIFSFKLELNRMNATSGCRYIEEDFWECYFYNE